MSTLFPRHTDWLQSTCYYVAATTFNHYALLAGPYPRKEAAEAVLETARRWALNRSGDPEAGTYRYLVLTANDGFSRSLLGELSPLEPGAVARFDAYEIQPCRRFREDHDPDRCYYEVCEPDEADVWTLYGHIPGQGVDAIGDFATRDHAEEVYYRITGTHYDKA